MLKRTSCKVAGLFVAAVLVFSGAVKAEEKPLKGPDIQQILSDKTAFYDDGAIQYFGAKGGTIYLNARGDREDGRWRVDGDRYCSHWGRDWDCYDMTGEGDRVSWLVSFGKDFKARLEDGKKL